MTHKQGPRSLASRLLCAALCLACLDPLPASAGTTTEPPITAPCQSARQHDFDFWIGDWVVTEQGKPAGTNRIQSLLAGCALLENWVGTDASRGHSLNFYDAGANRWQQTWVDGGGGVLNLHGGLSGASMVLEGSRPRSDSHQAMIDRITWTPRADKSVSQKWQQSIDQGKTWKTVFDGLYVRASGPLAP